MSPTTRDDEACPSTTTATKSTTATTPAVTTTIYDDGAPAAPSPKRRKVAAAAPAVVDERARLKRRIAWVADKIATHRDEVETPYGFPDTCYGYAGYGFVGWVRADFAGEERAAERAALEAWMQIEWERRLLRWRRGEQQQPGVNGGGDSSSFGVWDVDDDDDDGDRE
uniref:Uncharacterized protein n=1 Tax=Oryza glumipatula TaxID=40148 RepID=A0A0E0BL53_9ORYZ